MKNTFRMTLYTAQQLLDKETFRKLWNLLDTKIVSPLRYDSVERAKIPFSRDAIDSATELYQNYRLLFVRGGKDNFLAVFSEETPSLSKWTFWLDVRSMRGEKAKYWLEWLFHLCGELPILYGFACSTEEYDAKHTTVEILPDALGYATSTVGVSTAEFYQYLPGLYWLSIFGPELVQEFGKSRLLMLPGVKSFAIGSMQVAIWFDEPVLPEKKELRLKAESHIADLIGPQFFFDRNRTDLKFEPVPQLIRKLDELPPNQVGS